MARGKRIKAMGGDEDGEEDSNTQLERPPTTQAPAALVLGQTLWNTVQVAQIFLAICFVGVGGATASKCGPRGRPTILRRALASAVLTATILLLPLSVYLASPGGHIFAFITLACSIWAVAASPPDLEVTIKAERGTPPQTSLNESGGEAGKPYDMQMKAEARKSAGLCQRFWVGASQRILTLEMIGCVANLLCSLYNYNTSDNVYPHWSTMYQQTGVALGVTIEPAVGAQAMYTMGITGVKMPSYVPLAYYNEEKHNTVGAFVFLLVWSVLPFIYTAYFCCMYVMAPKTVHPYRWDHKLYEQRNYAAPHEEGSCSRACRGRFLVGLQRACALFGIFHFLFLTDFVDYKYGRGVYNPVAEYCHWTERIAWRIAIIVPIYQKAVTGHFKHGHLNKVTGYIVHYGAVTYVLFFFIYDVLMRDVFVLPQWIAQQAMESGEGTEALLTELSSWGMASSSSGEISSGSAAPSKWYEAGSLHKIMKDAGFGTGYNNAIGYHGALILMTVVYGGMVLDPFMACNHLYFGEAGESDETLGEAEADADAASRVTWVLACCRRPSAANTETWHDAHT
jgi:hypothetical protein